MLKVYAIQDKEQQRLLCSQCDVPYDIDLLAYAAEVDNTLVGICQFKMGPNGGSLRHLAPVTALPMDKQALFVLGRATLNFIDLCGIHFARFEGDTAPAGEQLIHAIGFRQNPEGVWEMDLTDFFQSPCQHDHS
jgi:hypothetical protein